MRTPAVPTFLAKQVCAALDVSHGTLNSWAHAGFFRQFDAAVTTPGKARKFSFDDLFRLLLITYCSDFGFSTSTATKLSHVCLDNSELCSQRVRIVLYADNSEEILLDDHEPRENPTLELSIYPETISGELRKRLAASDHPRVASMGRRRVAANRRSKS